VWCVLGRRLQEGLTLAHWSVAKGGFVAGRQAGAGTPASYPEVTAPPRGFPTDNPFTGKRDGILTAMMSEPAPKRRLKLNYSKCAQCRTAKKKVSTLNGRDWFGCGMLTLVVGP